MHLMRIKAQQYKKHPTQRTPLAKEIELRREEIIQGIIGNAVEIVNRQLEVASLPVSEDGKNNDTILKATNSLLDRAFGKPKESIDFTGQVQFSLRALSRQADDIEKQELLESDDVVMYDVDQ